MQANRITREQAIQLVQEWEGPGRIVERSYDAGRGGIEVETRDMAAMAQAEKHRPRNRWPDWWYSASKTRVWIVSYEGKVIDFRWHEETDPESEPAYNRATGQEQASYGMAAD